MRTHSVCIFLTLVIYQSLVSCKKEEKDEIDCLLFEWSYEGNYGPGHWGECICDCSTEPVECNPFGYLLHSPIDIVNYYVDHLKDLNPRFSDITLSAFNNGHTIEFECEGGVFINVPKYDHDYKILGFRMHTHSEHAIHGNFYPMEIQFDCLNTGLGFITNLSVLVREGNHNDLLERLVGVLPASSDVRVEIADSISLRELFPEEQGYFTYNGRHSIPPCDKRTWIILKTPIEASAAQLAYFESILGNNYRPILPESIQVVACHE